MTWIRQVLPALLFAFFPALADAADAACAPLDHDGLAYTVCTLTPGSDDLRLFRLDAFGQVLGSFERLNAMLARQGETLGFAMNAGMYHPDRSAVGLYIENGVQQHRAVASAGPGNFGLLPNGVLCLTDGTAQVVETRAYLARAPGCRYATQSGPMLVTGGKLHPRFLRNGTSRYIRNGVGVAADGTVYFAISEVPVTFYEFATLFRDVLHTPEALFLDGNVSRLYAPELGRSDGGFPMGPIVGSVVSNTR